MDENIDVNSKGISLVEDLDRLLDADPLIDEFGLLPSTAEENLPEELGKVETGKGNHGGSTNTNLVHEKSEALHTKQPYALLDREIVEQTGRLSSADGLHFDKSAFWYADHKLAIALSAVGPIQMAATKRFFSLLDQSRKLEVSKASEPLSKLEKQDVLMKLMKSTRGLVLLNGDHATAWSARKRLRTLVPSQNGPMLELQLASLVLSHLPKSAETWAHRRWALKQLASLIGWDSPDMQRQLADESHLVRQIAERAPMNYRAWSHRCWTVSHMQLALVTDELESTRGWVQRHVQDNCGLHYRRRLLEHILKASQKGSVYGSASVQTQSLEEWPPGRARLGAAQWMPCKADVVKLWERECAWNLLLLQRYPGREALWIHRRFLAHAWSCHIAYSQWSLSTLSLKSTPKVGSEAAYNANLPPPATSPGAQVASVDASLASALHSGQATSALQQMADAASGSAETPRTAEDACWQMDLHEEIQMAGTVWASAAEEESGTKENRQQCSFAASYHLWLLRLAEGEGAPGRRLEPPFGSRVHNDGQLSLIRLKQASPWLADLWHGLGAS